MRYATVWRGMGVGACALLMSASTALAQAGLQVPVEFEFLNPGARSLALGSAFVALADDASAAFTNPAGLTLLTRPEVSFEGRGRHLESPFLERGRLSGTVTNIGIDTVSGPLYENAAQDSFTPAFISYVYPSRNRWALAVYRHELTSVEQEFKAQGVFEVDPVFGDVRENALLANRDLSVTSYGAAFAYRPNDLISFGVGLSIADFSLESSFVRFAHAQFYELNPYDPSRAVFETTENGDGVGVGFTAGLLWTPRREFQVGAVFRKAPEFDFEQSLKALPNGTPTVTEGTFQVPDVFAAGAAWRPTEATMLTVEYTFVQYAALMEDYINVQAVPSGFSEQFNVESGSEFHAGFEYVLVNVKLTPALRVGYWFDPAHSVEFEPSANPGAFESRIAAYLPGEDGLSHFTFGAGLPINDRFELNGGADLSERRNFYSVFAVVRF